MSSLDSQDFQSGFVFTWSISNFSFCGYQENYFIESPMFNVGFLGGSEYQLEVYPNGCKSPGFISCFLEGNEDGDESVFAYALFIRKSDGQFEEIGRFEQPSEDKNLQSKFLSHRKLKESDTYLDNDILTVRCEMWKKDDDSRVLESCCAHTKIRVTKLNYLWTLDNICVSDPGIEYKFDHHITKIPISTSKVSGLSAHVSNGGQCGEDALKFEIEMINSKKCLFLVCTVSLLDVYSRVVHSTSSEHLFFSRDEGEDNAEEAENQSNDTKDITEVWGFPIISKRKLYANEESLLSNNKLNLRCEFCFSWNDDVVSVEYRKTEDLKPARNLLKPQLNKSIPWQENFQKLYKEGQLSDVVIRTPKRRFPAHRAILAAHSGVFRSMFEHDMKEQNSGVVDIDDLDDGTVDKMMKFLYGDSVGDLDCPGAKSLLYAADKYGVAPLQELCSNFLMGEMDASNACDLLVLANTHGDEELKLRAQDFIFDHARQIMDSQHWSELKESHPKLSLEVMDWICRKLLKVTFE